MPLILRRYARVSLSANSSSTKRLVVADSESSLIKSSPTPAHRPNPALTLPVAAGTIPPVEHEGDDDSQNEAKIKTRDFRAALDALLAGKPVAVSEAKAFGCTIKRVRSSS